jgi:predicted glycoside hydrolase/deacetylase ChbG (UPF0249 family)
MTLGSRSTSAEPLAASPRLTIVNADDWGYDDASTDRTLECLLAGRITSVSALVLMTDSARAARLARAHSFMPVGLHLNFTEPYDAISVPPSVCERQMRVARYFARHRSLRWVYNPLVRSAVRDVVKDQIAAFYVVYGRAPDHLDSHHHAHISPNVLLDGDLPVGVPLRRSFTFLPGEKSLLNRTVRHLMSAFIERAHPTTDYFFDIAALSALARIDDLASSTVELMTHPARASDYQLLMSEVWARLIANWRLGTYAELQ